MKLVVCLFVFAAAFLPMLGQAMPEASNDHAAAHKKLVHDFWREVIEARHLDLVAKYLKEDYIQHNPNVPTGRQGFIDYFSKLGKPPRPIEPVIKAPLIATVVQGDLVVLSFTSEEPDPHDKTKTYVTTWFDMFRIEDGMIAEHWDCDLKR